MLGLSRSANQQYKNKKNAKIKDSFYLCWPIEIGIHPTLYLNWDLAEVVAATFMKKSWIMECPKRNAAAANEL